MRGALRAKGLCTESKLLKAEVFMQFSHRTHHWNGSRSMGVLGNDYHQSPQLLVPSREFRKSLGDWGVASSQPGL